MMCAEGHWAGKQEVLTFTINGCAAYPAYTNFLLSFSWNVRLAINCWLLWDTYLSASNGFENSACSTCCSAERDLGISGLVGRACGIEQFSEETEVGLHLTASRPVLGALTQYARPWVKSLWWDWKLKFDFLDLMHFSYHLFLLSCSGSDQTCHSESPNTLLGEF